jgi:membrane protease YdiL (CAAX protease family)
MAGELLERAERLDRYILVLRDVLGVCFISGFMYWQSVPTARAGLRLDNWKEYLAIGSAAGLTRAALVSALNIFFPAVRRNPNMDYMRKGSLLFWVPSFFIGAFAEEFWIAICLVSFLQAQYSLGASVGLTVIAFGVVHFRYGFWAATGIAMLGVFSCLLFLWTRSLIATCLFHFIGNLAVFLWTRR